MVRATGGLEDTVTRFNSREMKGNGFKFGPYEPKALLRAIQEAVRHFRDPTAWKGIMANGMGSDFSWNRSARHYLQLYESVLADGTLEGHGANGD